MKVRLVALLCLADLAGPFGGSWTTTSEADEERAAAALAPLAARLNDPQANRDALRRDLIAFRRAHPGTQSARRAAAILPALPSPPDRLDPAKVGPAASDLPKEV